MQRRRTVPRGVRTDVTAGKKIVSVHREASNDDVCKVIVSEMYEVYTLVRVLERPAFDGEKERRRASS